MPPCSINKILSRALRYSGYVLFVCILTYFVTGLGMVKHLLDRRTAHEIHEDIMPVPTFAAFLVHSLLAIRIFLIRHGVREMQPWNISLILSGAAIFALFLHIFLR